MDFNRFMSDYQSRINTYLNDLLPPEGDVLQQAMAYAVQNGGKRFRPLLVYATGLSLNTKLEQLDILAASIELIHAYSLIHDDLPAMDNSDLRRGKPTCHKVFGEAIAILAGDALQSYAFELLAKLNDARLIAILAKACGTQGMAGGQMMDLTLLQQALTLNELQTIHLKKTGALLEACVDLVLTLCSELSPDQSAALKDYAHHLGLAFQIRDDILDVESCTHTLGKPQGLDALAQKNTYPTLLGLEKAHQYCQQAGEQACQSLKILPKSCPILINLAQFVVSRAN